MSLEIGGKVIAKYIGKRVLESEEFDESYFGSGTCWQSLLRQYMPEECFEDIQKCKFKDNVKWKPDKIEGSYYFEGKNNVKFFAVIVLKIKSVEYTDTLEQSIIKALVLCEGLNMDMINEYRKTLKGRKTKITKETEKFLEKYSKIKGGHGYFVNQRLSLNE